MHHGKIMDFFFFLRFSCILLLRFFRTCPLCTQLVIFIPYRSWKISARIMEKSMNFIFGHGWKPWKHHEGTQGHACGIQKVNCMYLLLQAFKTQKLLHRHMQQFHKLTAPKLDCPFEGCEYSFYKASELDRHYATHTGKLYTTVLYYKTFGGLQMLNWGQW